MSRPKSEACLDASYAWESEKIKNIPSIENFDFLAKLYGVHVEDLYVLKSATDSEEIEVHDYLINYEPAWKYLWPVMSETAKEEFCKILNVTEEQVLLSFD